MAENHEPVAVKKGMVEAEAEWATISMGRVFHRFPAVSVRLVGKTDANAVIVRDRRLVREPLLPTATL